jgi:hypothetical protein
MRSLRRRSPSRRPPPVALQLTVRGYRDPHSVRNAPSALPDLIEPRRSRRVASLARGVVARLFEALPLVAPRSPPSPFEQVGGGPGC